MSIKIPQTTVSTPVPFNETEIAQIVLSTVQAIQQQTPPLVNTPDPAAPCVQLPCPTCVAAEVNSPILPAPPTIVVPAQGDANTIVPKSVATVTPTVVPTPIGKPFQIQSSTPAYLPNFAHQDQACNWLGVGGQVFDLNGAPAKNIVLVIDGKLSDQTISMVGMTGTTSQYGPGGYEIVLSAKPVATTGTLTITVYDLNGLAVSDPIPFNTLNNCQKNLALINFQQIY